MKSAPEIEPLREVVRALQSGGLTVALGGSGLLAAHGLAEHVGDWDLTTDDDLDSVLRVVNGREHELFGSNGIHADHKVQLRGGEIEIIVRFALRWDDHVVRIPSW